jgi:hypothetical protein
VKELVMNRFLCLALLSVFILLSGCTSAYVTKRDAFPEMYRDHPLTILILPPINMSTASDAKELFMSTLAEPLSFRGYYVLPIEITTDILKNEGLYDIEAVKDLPPQKFKQYFGADAVMYVKILRWDTVYVVLGGSIIVEVEFLLKSTTTGKDLWRYSGRVEQNTSGTSRGQGIGALIANVIETGVKTAVTDYFPAAREASIITLSALPYGKYHPDFNKDGDTRIKKDKVILQLR